jgi:hypothetical protein
MSWGVTPGSSSKVYANFHCAEDNLRQKKVNINPLLRTIYETKCKKIEPFTYTCIPLPTKKAETTGNRSTETAKSQC